MIIIFQLLWLIVFSSILFLTLWYITKPLVTCLKSDKHKSPAIEAFSMSDLSKVASSDDYQRMLENEIEVKIRRANAT